MVNWAEPVRTERSALRVGRWDFQPGEREYLESLHPERHHPIRVYDRVCHPKRNTQFYSDEVKHYSFSMSKAPAVPLTPELRGILDRINAMFDDNYNGILANEYTSGTDNIGAHADNEAELGKSGVVMIVIGATRKFRIRDKKTKRIVKDVDLTDGTRAWMQGDFQKEFTHEIPVEKRRNGRRLSLTFRRHFP